MVAKLFHLHFVFLKEGGEFPETVTDVLEGWRGDDILKLAVVVIICSLLGRCKTRVHWVT